MHGMFDTNDKPKGKGKSTDVKEGKGKAKDANKGAAKGNCEKSEQENLCFRCGRTGHFSSNCHAKIPCRLPTCLAKQPSLRPTTEERRSRF